MAVINVIPKDLTVGKNVSINIAKAVWDKQTSTATPGTFGMFISKQLLTVAKFIGLK
jgi:hypothetical protein